MVRLRKTVHALIALSSAAGQLITTEDLLVPHYAVRLTKNVEIDPVKDGLDARGIIAQLTADLVQGSNKVAQRKELAPLRGRLGSEDYEFDVGRAMVHLRQFVP